MTLEKLIARARRMKAVKNGLVTCDMCDNPASKEASLALSHATCAPCAYGEADSFDASDLIPVGKS